MVKLIFSRCRTFSSPPQEQKKKKKKEKGKRKKKKNSTVNNNTIPRPPPGLLAACHRHRMESMTPLMSRVYQVVHTPWEPRNQSSSSKRASFVSQRKKTFQRLTRIGQEYIHPRPFFSAAMLLSLCKLTVLFVSKVLGAPRIGGGRLQPVHSNGHSSSTGLSFLESRDVDPCHRQSPCLSEGSPFVPRSRAGARPRCVELYSRPYPSAPLHLRIRTAAGLGGGLLLVAAPR